MACDSIDLTGMLLYSYSSQLHTVFNWKNTIFKNFELNNLVSRVCSTSITRVCPSNTWQEVVNETYICDENGEYYKTMCLSLHVF